VIGLLDPEIVRDDVEPLEARAAKAEAPGPCRQLAADDVDRTVVLGRAAALRRERRAAADEGEEPTTTSAIRILHIRAGCGTVLRTTQKVAVSGARRARTADLLIANQALSQLSYSPTRGEF
jgi:hypothetical protein